MRSPFLLDLKERLATTFASLENKALDYLDNLTPTSASDLYSDVKRRKRASVGEERLEALRDLLDHGMGVNRSKMQITFHEHFLAACAKHIFAEDDDVDWSRIKKNNNWEDTKSVVLCQTRKFFLLRQIRLSYADIFYSLLHNTARRFGKTWSVGVSTTICSSQLFAPMHTNVFSFSLHSFSLPLIAASFQVR